MATPAVVVRTLYRQVLRHASRYARVASERGFPLEHEVARLSTALSRPVFLPAAGVAAGEAVSAAAVRDVARGSFRAGAAEARDEVVSGTLVPDAFAALRWLVQREEVVAALPLSTRSERTSGPCRVSVVSRSVGRDRQSVHKFAYDIELRNVSDDVTFQLASRRWDIVDGFSGAANSVEGAGVIGKHPTLRPGDSFKYGSWTPLGSPLGRMHGSFKMVLSDGDTFEAHVDPFLLAAGEYVPPGERAAATAAKREDEEEEEEKEDP